MQVILTGASHHGAADPSQAPTPAEASAAVGQRVLAAADAHPLRPYWDYLAFLLRRLPALAPEEEMERSYRDYLQVFRRSAQDCVLKRLPCHVLSSSRLGCYRYGELR